jgi:7,8-dihydropterin-6-yl-methyl-4-(beta-D-ribofuranosyl)aminobenzene 5'-phosphate synthase
MKITPLIENTVSKRDLIAEHGLSFFIEHEDANILFDTGQSKNFDLNAKQLGIDITTIDYLIISHGHYDHIGGLSHFIENNEKAEIIIKKETLWPKFKFDQSIGMSKLINIKNPRFQFVDQITEIVKGIFIVPETKQFFSIDRHINDFYTQSNEKIIKDEFSDELFLVFKNNDGISIFSSCSHNGITNMAETVKKHFGLPLVKIIGGFHIKNATDLVVDHISEYFNKNEIEKVYACHCTGLEKFNRLKLNCGEMVSYNETGNVITI